MNMTGNTLLITGGGSGIGRALAEAFHAEGNKVIIAGRRHSALAAVVAANPGMAALELDIENAAGIREFAARLTCDFPALNAVIHNAGIMRAEDLRNRPDDLDTVEATIATNLLGPMRLTAALLPHLMAQADATIMTVSSGLAFLPLARTPAYSASKAAIHSWSQSLRFQLRGTPVKVIELAPPYVQTELTGPAQASDPHAMPLAEFTAEVMALLAVQPDAAEILVERVKPLRFAERSGGYDEFFENLNSRF